MASHPSPLSRPSLRVILRHSVEIPLGVKDPLSHEVALTLDLTCKCTG
jgi:hypothetical protein